MQIICNNCGNELNFPNRQNLVTCPYCYTHLQIEETDNTITATIVENPNVNNSLFMSLNQLSTIQSFAPLYNLLHLELEYNDEIEENFFHSILVGRRFRPIFSRGLFRLLIGLFLIAAFITPDVFNFLSVAVIAYSAFLAVIGAKEIIKAWRFRQFEKYYFKEQARLNEEIQNIDLSDKLKVWYFIYSKNVQEHLAVRDKYFYIHLFKMKINILTPLLSQGFRLFFIIVLLVGFMIAYEGLMVPIVTIIMIAAIMIIIILFASTVNKGNTYTSTYLTLLHSRKEIIEELKEYLSE